MFVSSKYCYLLLCAKNRKLLVSYHSLNSEDGEGVDCLLAFPLRECVGDGLYFFLTPKEKVE